MKEKIKDEWTGSRMRTKGFGKVDASSERSRGRRWHSNVPKMCVTYHAFFFLA